LKKNEGDVFGDGSIYCSIPIDVRCKKKKKERKKIFFSFQIGLLSEDFIDFDCSAMFCDRLFQSCAEDWAVLTYLCYMSVSKDGGVQTLLNDCTP
jgi:hypothetical protein